MIIFVFGCGIYIGCHVSCNLCIMVVTVPLALLYCEGHRGCCCHGCAGLRAASGGTGDCHVLVPIGLTDLSKPAIS